MFFDTIRASNKKKEFERGFAYVCIEMLLYDRTSKMIEFNLHDDHSEFEKGAKQALFIVNQLKNKKTIDDLEY